MDDNMERPSMADMKNAFHTQDDHPGEGETTHPVVFYTTDQWSDLQTWWIDNAMEEASELVDKAREYGGTGRAKDLVELGQTMVDLGIRIPDSAYTGKGNIQEGFLQELGIYFYLVGKMGRWSAALQSGHLVSDDTLKDIGIYVRMAQRARNCGGWPV